MTDYYYDLIFKLAKIIALSINNQSSYELEELTRDLAKFTSSKSFQIKADFYANTKIFIPKPIGVIIPGKVCVAGNVRCVLESFYSPYIMNDDRIFGLQFFLGKNDSGLCSLRFDTENQRDTFFDLVVRSIAGIH